jgi:hypothetical protein
VKPKKKTLKRFKNAEFGPIDGTGRYIRTMEEKQQYW